MIYYIIGGVILYLLTPIVVRLATFKAPRCDSKASLKGKTAIVTGANAGLGKHTAENLAMRGARVFIACRNLEKASRARDEIVSRCPDANLVLIKLDLASLSSVKACAEEFLKSSSRLDILVNNAGFSSMEFRLTEDGIENHLGSNHLGHFYLTRLLLPLMETSGTDEHKSRIVNLSSAAHLMAGTIDYEGLQKGTYIAKSCAYGASKLANIFFTRYLSKLLAGHPVTVNAVHPGTVRTNFFKNMISSQTLLQRLNPVMWLILYPTLVNSYTSQQGAQTQIYAAVDESLEGVSGQYLGSCKISKPFSHAFNEEEAEKLWRWSCSKTSLTVELDIQD